MSLEKEVLEKRLIQLEETLQINARKHSGVIAAKKAAATDDAVKMMHFNQGSYNQFFNLSPPTNGEEKK